jgi:hypothetical protein
LKYNLFMLVILVTGVIAIVVPFISLWTNKITHAHTSHNKR